MSDVEDTFKELIEQFHQKMNEDADAKGKLAGKEVTMVVEITDEQKYKFHLKEAEIVEFGVGEYEEPDVRLFMEIATFKKLQSQELSPMRAFMEKKVTFKGSMSHLLLMRGVLGAD